MSKNGGSIFKRVSSLYNSGEAKKNSQSAIDANLLNIAEIDESLKEITELIRSGLDPIPVGKLNKGAVKNEDNSNKNTQIGSATRPKIDENLQEPTQIINPTTKSEVNPILLEVQTALGVTDNDIKNMESTKNDKDKDEGGIKELQATINTMTAKQKKILEYIDSPEYLEGLQSVKLESLRLKDQRDNDIKVMNDNIQSSRENGESEDIIKSLESSLDIYLSSDPNILSQYITKYHELYSQYSKQDTTDKLKNPFNEKLTNKETLIDELKDTVTTDPRFSKFTKKQKEKYLKGIEKVITDIYEQKFISKEIVEQALQKYEEDQNKPPSLDDMQMFNLKHKQEEWSKFKSTVENEDFYTDKTKNHIDTTINKELTLIGNSLNDIRERQTEDKLRSDKKIIDDIITLTTSTDSKPSLTQRLGFAEYHLRQKTDFQDLTFKKLRLIDKLLDIPQGIDTAAKSLVNNSSELLGKKQAYESFTNTLQDKKIY